MVRRAGLERQLEAGGRGHRFRLHTQRINIGLNDWDFTWRLMPGESFSTPASFAGYTRAGFGAASRQLHDFIRDTILPHGHVLRKVLYNSWEATFFDVDEASQVELAQHAVNMGVEPFVIDDGWFHGRNSDNAGLGDWWPDRRKFPHGLAPLIAQVEALGLEFGLWIEPEMVNPDSDLYRAAGLGDPLPYPAAQRDAQPADPQLRAHRCASLHHRPARPPAVRKLGSRLSNGI